MAILGSATYKLESDNTQLNRGLAKAEQSTTASMQRIGKRMTVALTAPIVAGAAGLFKIVESYDQARRALVFSTGASGKGLDGLMASFRKINGIVDASMSDISKSLGDFHTILGLTGPALEEASRNALILGLDSRLVARGMQVFSVKAKDAALFVDQLGVVARATGIPINELATNLREYGPVLKNAGFEAGEAAAFLGSLDKAGINASRIFPGLNMTLRRLAEEGVPDLKAALFGQIEAIRTATSDTKALALATEFFGAEGAQRLVVAIKNNVFQYEELERAMHAAKGQTVALDQETLTLGQRIKLITAEVREQIAFGWNKLSPVVQIVIMVLGALIAILGPLMLAIGFLTPGLISFFKLFSLAGLLTFGKFALIALAIAALVVAIIWLVHNWDEVVARFKALPLWAKIAAGAITLFLLPAFVKLIAMMGLTLARFVLFKVRWIAAQAVWLATSLVRFAVWSATSLATFATWIATSLVRFAVWSATSLATFAVWIARTLVMFMTWAKAMVVRWLIALGPLGLIIAGVAALGGAAVLLMMNWDSIDTRWRQLWDGLKDKAVGVMNAIIEKINALIRAWNSIPVVPDVGEIGKINPNSIGTPTLESALNFAGGAFGGPLLQLVGGGGLGTLLKKGAGLLGGTGGGTQESPERWGIPGLAKGGIVTGPTFARLGEEGTEVVLPLDKLGKGMGGGLTIIFQGDVYGFEDFQDRVRDTVDEEVRRGVVFGTT